MAPRLPDVAFVADSLAVGGAERQLSYMVRVLRDAGSRVCVLTLARDGGFADEIRARGAQVSSIGPSGTSHLTRLARLARVGKAFAPDILQSAHFHTNLYAAIVGRLVRVPSIGAVRSSIRFSLDHVPRYGRLSLRAPTIVAANSRAAVDEATSLGVEAARVTLLPNVVDTDAFSPRRQSSSSMFTVCWIGSAKPEKRHDLVTRAFTRAFSGDTHVRLVVHGGERWRHEIEEAAARSGSADQVEFVRAGDPVATYHRSDALVLASDVEGTPNVVLEAMACGLPVVATAVGGVPELLRGGGGLLARPDDVEGLAEALVHLRSDPDARREMGRTARREVEERWALTRLPDELADLYRRAGAS